MEQIEKYHLRVVGATPKLLAAVSSGILKWDSSMSKFISIDLHFALTLLSGSFGLVLIFKTAAGLRIEKNRIKGSMFHPPKT